MKRIIMAACIVSLAACGGDKDDVATEQQQDWESQKQSLVYSFPDNDQEQVPVPSPVVLRFSSPVMETAPAITLREAGGAPVSDFEMEWVDGKRGLIITPNDKLKPLTEYVVDIPGIELEKGAAPARSLRFLTRGLYEGPKNSVADETFEITRMIPDGENYPVMDFSSLRVQFSQPLLQNTVKYGNDSGATIQLVGPEGLVDAHLLVSGSYVTVDPKEDLRPGVEYSLNFGSAITSIYGESMPGDFGNGGLSESIVIIPQDTTSPTTGQRVAMVQDVADTGELSPLTGRPINLVPMSSVLLGEDTATQAKAIVAAELAFVPNFPDATPFRVKRGSLIEGASIEVLIGGEVPAGFESGKVRMDFLSDATGYLLPNPYSNADDAPRQVRLFMDVAVSTETPRANGAITQDLMHIELVGTSIVEEGQMVINAVGVVEPDVLGSERATGLLSFYMKAFEDQDNPPQIVEDTSPIEFQSWSHEDTTNLSVSHPIVVNYSKAIERESVENIKLIETSNNDVREIDVDVEVKGAALVIKPKETLRAPYEIPAADPLDSTIDNISYSLVLDENVSGLSGPAAGPMTLDFAFAPETSEVKWTFLAYAAFTGLTTPNIIEHKPDQEERFLNQSVVLLATYPGFPCAMDESEQDLSQGIAGRCAGTLSEEYINEEGTRHRPADDLLPIHSLPQNAPIIVQGSQDFLPESVRLGGSFLVEEIDQNGSFVAGVDGDVVVEGARITFTPEDPWKEGSFYRYTVRSNNDDINATQPTQCDGTQAVCDTKMRPLQTKLYSVEVSAAEAGAIVLKGAYSSAGGPDFRHVFRGGPASQNVLQALVAKPVDTNANFYHDVDGGEFPDSGEQAIDYIFSHRNYANDEEGVDPLNLEDNPHPYDPGGIKPIPNSAKLLSKAWSPIVLQLDEFGNPVFDSSFNLVFESGYPYNAINIGCNHVGPPYQLDFMDLPGSFARPYVSLDCPDKKFTYLHSALMAEVTSEYVPGKGLKVLIWPGQIVGTSIVATTVLNNFIFNQLDTGKQLMRIRYAKDDPDCVDSVATPCARTKPVEGWISFDGSKPVMSADVDLYIDAAGLGDNVALALEDVLPNLVSVPVTMNLEGDVEFNENGQMVVSQFNTNEVVIGFELEQLQQPGPNAFRKTMGSFDIIVPAGGSYIQYTSDIIR